MNVPGNMAVMNAAGGAVGPAPGMNQAGGRAQAHFEPDEQKRLNTYIYDYLLKLEKFELARTFYQECHILVKQEPSPSRGVNGVDDLPVPEVPGLSDNTTCFLYDWWCQFWDVYGAKTKMGPTKATAATMEYLQYNYLQTKQRQALHQQMLQPGAMRAQYAAGMMTQPNGMAMSSEMAKRGIPANRNATPQQLQQMQQIVQAKMMQNSMQRDGSNMEMGGRRSNSPGTMDNVPSPSKRARLDGGSGFNGQPMGPAGRGQPMSGPQMNTLNAAAGPNGGMMMQNGVADLQHQQQLAFAGQTPNIPQKQIEAMNANMQAGQLPGQAMDGIDFSGINGPRMGAAGTTQGGNHALQDYQMQLMLLEQQNKKRLLMARQEQDNMGTPHPGAGANPQFTMAASMSPSQSRAGGPSPNPNEMKRVASTPKLAQGGVPGSPMPDMQNRGSPAPGFDPSQMAQGMHPSIYNQMAANIGRAPSSHPGYPMSNLSQQQQLEVLRRSGGMIANGQPFPQGPQILQQNIQNPQQPPPQLGTPQQRHGTMAPPPAPAASQEQQRTQPSSPAQNQAPPNPSQNPKGAPKSKKEAKAAANKKNPQKKQNATAATPAAESAEPPTPTPSTPITPRHPDSFNKQQNGNNAANAQQPPNATANAPQSGPTQQPAAPAAPAMPVAAPPAAAMDFDAGQDFGLTFGDDMGASGFNLDFATSLDTTDVLDNFDFDSLLNTDGGLPFGE